MKFAIVLTVTAILLLILAVVMFVIIAKTGGGLTRMLGITDDYQYCSETKTTAKEFTTNLQTKISSGQNAKSYYEFHANAGCFQDPKKIEIDEEIKCKLFCNNGNFEVSKRIKTQITRFCKSC